MIRKFRRWSIAGLIAISSAGAFAQNNDLGIKLKSGVYQPAGKIESVGSQSRISSYSPSYVLVQFSNLPNAAKQAELKLSGIELLEFLSGNAYWARLTKSVDAGTASRLGIISLEKIKGTHKIDPKLTASHIPAHALRGTSDVAVTVGYFEGTSSEDVKNALLNLHAVIISSNTNYRTFQIEIAKKSLSALAAIGAVSFVVPVQIAPQLNNFEGRNSHRVNVAQNTNAGGRGLTGNGVVVGVGEGDRVTNHVDFQNRLTENTASTNVSDHKSHVAGTIAGNGNIDPRGKGMAPRATIIGDDGFVIIDNGSAYHQNTGMVLVNHSWRFDVHGIYDDFSRKIDEQNYTTPGIMHVVAASNEGPGFRTVGDAHIAAKNSLTVGAVMPNDDIAMFSSRGPAADGRIKPEIVSVGTHVYSTTPNNTYQAGWAGTSMSTPGTVGSLTLFAERYKQLNNNATPYTGIIKAIACNTADDLGNTGPDFTYGFGKINLRRALEGLEANRYVKSTVNAGASATHTINVPANTQELKVLLYWIDKAGNVQSAQALVNDLNLRVSNGTTYLPWVLNPAVGSENNSATKGVDHINNIEQVSVTDPAAGTYTITVDGSAIALGAQDYVVSYEFVKKEILLSYPLGGESLQPGEGVYLRWDAAGTNNFSIDYSANNGTTWTSIATSVHSSTRAYSWIPPNTGSVIIRVSDGTRTATSGLVNIIAAPASLASSNNTLSWTASAGAVSYNVYLLKSTDKEMQLVANTTSPFYTFTNLNAGEVYWASVSAKNATAESERAYAVSFTTVPANNCTDPAWDAAVAYLAGAKVSYENVVYTANWWTKDQNPKTNSGPLGTGKPWTETAKCGVENKAPLVTYTAPAKNSVFNAGVSITLKAEAVDADGTISKVEFINASDVVIFTDNIAPYEYTLTGLTAGSYIYKVKAYDNKNLASDVAFNNFEVVNTQPTVVITSPTQGQVINLTPGAKITVTATTTPAVVDSVKYIVVDVTCNGPGCASTRRFVSTTAPYTVSYDPIPGAIYSQVNAVAFKNGVGSTNASAEYTVKYVSGVKPVIAITSSLQGQTFYEYPSDGRKVDVTLTQQNASEAPIDRVEYTVIDLGCDGPGCATVRKFTVTTAPFGLNFDPIYTAYATRYSVVNTEIDAVAFSNGTASDVKTIYVKVKPLPELTFVAPLNNSSVERSVTSIPVNVNVNSNQIDIDSVVYTVYDTKTTGMSGVTTTRKFVVRKPLTNFDLPVLADQTFTKIFALAYGDGAKFSKSQQVQVNYNNVPVIVITSPLPVSGIQPKYLVGGSITVSANVTDTDGGIVKVEFTQGGTTIGQVIKTAAPYTATFTNLPAPLPDGSYWFTVKAYDNLGAVTSQHVIVYKNRIPSIVITSPVPNASYASGTTVVVTTAPYDPDFTSGKIEYFNGAAKLGETVINGTLTTPTVNFNLTGLAVGNYALTAKITDDMGQSAVSSVVNFSVTGGGTCTDPAWNATTVYTGGEIVSRLSKRYQAKWWTQNNAPETNSNPANGGAWSLLGNCGAASRLTEESTVNSISVYPTPFVSDATVAIELAADDKISIDVFNIYGVKVATVFLGAIEAGSHSFTLSSQILSAGVYIVHVSGATINDKITVVKN